MGGGFPLGLELCNGTDIGTVTASSTGTTLTSNATAGVKGSYVQLIASTAADACWLAVQMRSDSSVGSAALDVAVGAGGSEVIIANNLWAQDATSQEEVVSYLFPVSIPKGTRVAARVASGTSAGPAFFVTVQLFDGAFTQIEGAAGLDSLGVTVSTMTATQLTSGAANTKGSFAQLIASTARDYMGLFLVFDNNGISGTPSGTTHFLVDLAIGAAASEKVIIPNVQAYWQFANTVEYKPAGPIGPYWIPIPAGTRISARCQDSVGSNAIFVLAHGIYQ
jgi:hypothetical protein